MISGGNHLEWPKDMMPGKLYEGDIEMVLEAVFDYEFDEAMWAWTLEQGPPQDDDIVWLKDKAYDIGIDTALAVIHLTMQGGHFDKAELRHSRNAKLEAL